MDFDLKLPQYGPPILVSLATLEPWAMSSTGICSHWKRTDVPDFWSMKSPFWLKTVHFVLLFVLDLIRGPLHDNDIFISFPTWWTNRKMTSHQQSLLHSHAWHVAPYPTLLPTLPFISQNGRAEACGRSLGRGTSRLIVRLIDSGDQYAVKPENLRIAWECCSPVASPMAISMAQQWLEGGLKKLTEANHAWMWGEASF